MIIKKKKKIKKRKLNPVKSWRKIVCDNIIIRYKNIKSYYMLYAVTSRGEDLLFIYIRVHAIVMYRGIPILLLL